jgi:hypothetical protein
MLQKSCTAAGIAASTVLDDGTRIEMKWRTR